MLIQIIGIVVGIIGYFYSPIAFLVGGLLCLIVDIYGFISGKLNLGVPIVLYIIGFIVLGSWRGILAGAIIGNAIDPIFSIVGGIALSVFNKKDYDA